MIAEIDLGQAQARTWDVIVAGTSFSAMFFAHGLPRGLNVLFVEKGVVESHADQLAGQSQPDRDDLDGQPVGQAETVDRQFAVRRQFQLLVGPDAPDASQ